MYLLNMRKSHCHAWAFPRRWAIIGPATRRTISECICSIIGITFALYSFELRFLSFFESPASESAIAMACFRSVTVGPFLEPECNIPSLNLCNSSLMRFCFVFFGALRFSFGIITSSSRIERIENVVRSLRDTPMFTCAHSRAFGLSG